MIPTQGSERTEQYFPAQRLGYDPFLLVLLSPEHRSHLDGLSHAWLFSCTLLSYPVAYAAWIVEHSLLLSLALFVFTFLMVLNLLRLTISGGGSAPTQLPNANYRPSLLPSILICGLALMLSGPAQLALSGASTEIVVQEHRTDLIRVQNESRANLGLKASDAFSKRLADCEFILLRLKLVWTNPSQAIGITTLYLMLILLPALLSRAPYQSAISSYENLRWQRAAHLISRGQMHAKALQQAHLARFSTYQPSESKKGLFIDIPCTSTANTPDRQERSVS